MLTYRYWRKVEGSIVVDGQARRVTAFGGSNKSPEEAERAARERLAAVQRKIDGDRSAFREYEAAIREEVVREVNPDNVVTRNRYGALVLNSRTTMMIDIDRPPVSLAGLLPWKPKLGPKERIIDMVRKKAAKHPGLCFRVYETQKGIRVIVLGREFAADSPESGGLMRDFNADALYALLCRKQRCFRARLTPKPSRMKFKARKVVFPRETGEENAEHDAWVAAYEERSADFAVCRFVEGVGSALDNEAVRFHDDATKAHKQMALA